MRKSDLGMKKTGKHPAIRWVFIFAWPFCIMALFESIARGSVGDFVFWLQTGWAGALCINYLIFFVPVHLLAFIRHKGAYLVGQILLAVFLLMLAVANHYKMQLRLEPVLPEDIHQLGAAFHIAVGYIENFHARAGLLIAVSALLCAGVLVVLRGQRRRGAYWLPALPALALAACLVLYVNQGAHGLLRKGANAAFNVRYSLMQSALYNGYAFQTLAYCGDHAVAVSPPQGYTYQSIAQIVLEAESEALIGEDRPNVIFILGESMADLGKLSELEMGSDPIPNIHSLMASHPSGVLTVPSYGGGTHMAEALALSGLSDDAYLPHRLDSLGWRFSALGYHTSVIHTYWGWFYDRQAHLKDMGFDLFVPLEAMSGKPAFSPYPKDELLYNQVLKTLRQSNERDFIYAATMQAHGGYDYKALYDTAFCISSLPTNAARELNNYLFLAHEADKALGDFIQALLAFDEPVMVVYFGDHYPAIPMTLEALSLELSDGRLYESLYFIWANFPFEGEGADLTMAQLPARALSMFSLPMTSAQRLSLKTLGASSEEAETLQKKLGLLKYDAYRGNRYAADALGLDFANERYQIGAIPRVDEMILTKDGGLIIKGENLSWRIVVKAGHETALLLMQTDGDTAWAALSPQLYESLKSAPDSTLQFVDDTKRAFYSLDAPKAIYVATDMAQLMAP